MDVQDRIDSLYKVVENANSPINRMNAYYKLIELCMQLSRKHAIQYCEESYQYSVTLDDSQVEAKGIGNFSKGVSLYFQNKISEGDIYLNEAIVYYKKSQSLDRIAILQSLKSMILWDKGELDRALDAAYKAREIYVQTKNYKDQILSSYLLGGYYMDMKDFVHAEEYYSEALNICLNILENSQSDEEKQFVIQRMSRCYVGVASVQLEKENYSDAQSNYYKALDIQLEHEDFMGESRSYNDLGKLYRLQKNYTKSEEYLKKSEQMRRQRELYSALITTLIEKAILLQELKSFEKAENTLEEAAQLAVQEDTKAKLYRIYKLQSKLFEKTNQFQKALKALKNHQIVKDMVYGEEMDSKLNALESKLEAEKVEKEAEIQRIKNVELKGAYDKIEKKNKDITASIQYAKRIQEAILPPHSRFKKYFEAYFISYKPKHIVSGDFYWMGKKDDKLIVAAVDCTGHGVPGAMMTMLGNALLNNILRTKDIQNAADILYQLDEAVQANLQQSKDNDGPSDGMDVSLVMIDTSKQMINFAGAKNPLFIIQNNELTEIKGSKFPIGSAQYKIKKSFDHHSISYKKGDVIYLASDGFQDQFGGEHQKKFMKKRFKALMLEHHTKAFEVQKDIFEKEFEDWKLNSPQTDDILLIGIGL